MPIWLLVILGLVALAPAVIAVFPLGDLAHDMRRLAVLARMVSIRLDRDATRKQKTEGTIAVRRALKEIERQLMLRHGV
jgi:hypothetical protein